MVIALILAGGIGTRLGGGTPKQYLQVAGRPVISYCLETLSKSEKIDAIWIVAAAEWQGQITEWLEAADVNRKWKGFSLPGSNRQLSIYHGLLGISGIASDEDYVFVHDAARPMLTEADIKLYVDRIAGHDGVIPVLPMKDTVYLSKDGKSITALLDRSRIYAGQAPELFVLGKYREANERLIQWAKDEVTGELEVDPSSAILKVNGATEPAVMAGMDVVMVPGNEGNFKITTQKDFERFKDNVKSKFIAGHSNDEE